MAMVSRAFGRKLACGVFLTGLCVLLAGRPVRSADGAKGVSDVPLKAVVHVCSQKLSGSDTLTDGPSGKRVEVTGETTLIWVDLSPDARYAHDTEYVLIDAHGSRVVKGQWWPVLNGKDILRGEKSATVTAPIELTEK